MGGSPNGSPRQSPLPVPRNYANNRGVSQPHPHYYSMGPNSVAPAPVGGVTASVNNNTPQTFTTRPTPPPSPLTGQQTQWKSKLSNIKNSLMGTPRFHRRKGLTWLVLLTCGKI